jgi:superfamily II DNA/RNA helicase
MENMQAYGFRSFIMEGLREMNIDTPTPIQERAIPEWIAGNDLIVQSKTGTGKTLAFLLPILQKIKMQSEITQALILAPTRELAQQTYEQVVHFTNRTSAVQTDQEGQEYRLRSILLCGGVDPERQFSKLKHAPHIIVATPGRLNDAITRQRVTLDQLRWMIVDEADTMVKMGFIEQVGEWLRNVPRAQKGLFSATMPEKIRRIVLPYMRQPSYVQIADKWTPVEELELHTFEVSDPEREAKFMELARMYNPYLAIVFTNTRTRADALGDAMARNGFQVLVLHGDLQARQRKQVVNRFREGKYQWLVATDIAARGIDVEGISHIFHYELPQNMEWFTHRNGRTARAGMDGIAVALLAAHEWDKLREFEKQSGTKMQAKKIHAGELVDRIVQPRKLRPLVEGRTRKTAEEIRAEQALKSIRKTSPRKPDAQPESENRDLGASTPSNKPKAKSGIGNKPNSRKNAIEALAKARKKAMKGEKSNYGKVQTVRRPEGKGGPSQK